MVLYVGSAWDLNLDDWHSMAFFQPRPHFSSSIISQLDVWQSGEVLWYWMSSCVIAFCNMFLKPRDKKWSSSLKSITSVAYRFARVVAEVLKETTLSLTTKLPQVGYTNLSTAKTCITSRHMFLIVLRMDGFVSATFPPWPLQPGLYGFKQNPASTAQNK